MFASSVTLLALSGLIVSAPSALGCDAPAAAKAAKTKIHVPDVVRAYADAMLDKRRDTYGAKHTPLFYDRFQQTRQPRFRELALAGADRYLEADPPEGAPITPKTLAPAIALLNSAYRLTKDRKHLARSEHQTVFFFADILFETLRRGATGSASAEAGPHSDVVGCAVGIGGLVRASALAEPVAPRRESVEFETARLPSRIPFGASSRFAIRRDCTKPASKGQERAA
jgi:hypothetical protein